MTGLSFEFFPPRSEKGRDALRDLAGELAMYGPSYFSVTFGAGGSTRDGTRDTLDDLRSRVATPTAAHLCYSGVCLDEVLDYADALWAAGHRRIVALRGDAEPVENQRPGTTAEFVRLLRERNPFEIAVACYPEVHPKARSPEADLDVLLAKQEAGATHAITQFFFENERYFAFVEAASRHGVSIPIVPGLLPVYDIDKAVGFAESCGSSVPRWVRDRFAAEGPEAGRRLIEEQAAELARADVPDLHIYTLNRETLAVAAARAYRAGAARLAAA